MPCEDEEEKDFVQYEGAPKRRNLVSQARRPAESSHVGASDNGIDFLAHETLQDGPTPFIPEESEIIPFGRENPAIRTAMEEDDLAVVSVNLEHDLLQKINIDRYYICLYTTHATARVYFRDSEEGRMACEVKKAYLTLKKIHGSKALKSGFSASLNTYNKDQVLRMLYIWTLWHSAWVYDEVPPIPWTERHLPLPIHMTTVRNDIWNNGSRVTNVAPPSHPPMQISNNEVQEDLQAPIPMEIDEVEERQSAIIPDPTYVRNDNTAFESESDQDSDECSLVSDLFDGVDLDLLPQD